MSTKPKTSASPWTPVGPRILLKLETPKEESEKTTTSGIIIPLSDSEKKKESPHGILVAVGACEISANPGDMILYTKQGCDEVRYKGERYVFVPIENALGVKNY